MSASKGRGLRIFKQQDVLHAKLTAIDFELHAIDVYEAAKSGKASPGRRRPKKAI